LRKTQKPKNPNFLKKMDPEKPRKTQKPKNPKTQVLPTLFVLHVPFSYYVTLLI